ncbi:MAG: acid phosphatase [Bacteroidetes bacterium]|jgi:tartrate-resistant acid phosphatase type 5|nr:acid phosphatase [Bacteroidota bacterium]
MRTNRAQILLFPLLLVVIIIIGCWIGGLFIHQQHLSLPSAKDYNFFFVTDYGSVTGPGMKKQIADQMNLLAPKVNPRYIISAGDNFHSESAMSATDPAWKTNFEQFFKVGYIKNLDWYTGLGNHDYAGNPQAQLDYAKIHPHWNMPARYYTFIKKTDDSTSIRFVILDTNPFQTKYLKSGHADVARQDTKMQLHWMDSVLASSHERWKIVIGHHPIVNSGIFTGIDSKLIEQINPLLKKYKVDVYFSGHVHSFQHQQKDNIDYVVGASTWKGRIITPWLYSKYWKNSTGFTLCSVDAHHFRFYFINEKGHILYRYSRNK